MSNSSPDPGKQPESGYYDAFISYSRQDKAFVKALHEALTALGLALWFDKTDIPAAANFPDEIQQGIERSNHLLFIMSADSLASEWCRREIVQALIYSKKIVPVSYRQIAEVDFRAMVQGCAVILDQQSAEWSSDTLRTAKSALEKLAQINRVAFNPNEFDEPKYIAFDLIPVDIRPTVTQALAAKLKTTFEIDLDYVRQHTRWLVRAHEWEAARRKPGALLGKVDLKEADQWLSTSAGKVPDPTKLHQEYILASKKRAETVRRRNSIIVSVTLAALALLTVLAFWQQQVARAERDRANRNEEEAIAERNEAQSVTQTFAIVDSSQKYPVGPGANRPQRVGFEMWISSREDGLVRRFKVDTGAQVGEPIPVGKEPREPVFDGTYVWVSNAGDDSLTRIDPAHPDAVITVPVGRTPLRAVVAGDSVWVLSDSDGTLTQVEQKSAEVIQTIEVGRGAQEAVFDGTTLWVSSPRDRALVRVDAASGAVQSFDVDRNPLPLVVAGADRWLIDERAGTIQRVDPDQGPAGEPIPFDSLLSQGWYDGTWLWVIAYDTQQVLQLDPGTAAVVRRFEAGADVRWIFPAGDRLWLLAADNALRSYDVNSGEKLTETTLAGNFTAPVIDGLQLWLSNTAENAILMIRLSDGALLRSLTHCEGPSQPVFDGANLWVSCEVENVVARIPALMSYYYPGQFGQATEPRQPLYTRSGDQEYVWILEETEGRIIVFDVNKNRLLRTIPVGEGLIEPVYDGSYVWAGSTANPAVTRIDARDPARKVTFPLKSRPTFMTLIGDQLWVSGLGQAKPDVTVISRVTGRTLAEFETGLVASQAVYDAEYGMVWLCGASISGGLAYRIDAEQLEIVSTTPVGLVSREPILDGDSVWVASIQGADIATDMFTGMVTGTGLPGEIYHLRRADGAALGDPIKVGDLPTLPVIAGGHIWLGQSLLQVFGPNQYSLAAIDTQTGEIAKTWLPCQDVNWPVYIEPYVWVVCMAISDDVGKVLAIDPLTLEIVQEYPDIGLGSWPAEQIGDYVWVVHQTTNNASLFRVSDGEWVGAYGLGRHPSPPTWDGGDFVWISNAQDGTVQRVRAAP